MKISKITKLEKEQMTVDIEVSGSHTYQLSNGCVSHNTVSQLVNSAEGIHARHNPTYLRAVRMDKKDPLCQFMTNAGFYVEDAVGHEDSMAVVYFPILAPEDTVYRDSRSAIEVLEHWLLYQREWCEHKPSITVSVRAHEWPEVGTWVWKHFDEISGVSFLPHFASDTSYVQLPYQDLTREEYDKWVEEHPLPPLDWAELGKYEQTDNTTAPQTLACSAGSCELPGT